MGLEIELVENFLKVPPKIILNLMIKSMKVFCSAIAFVFILTGCATPPPVGGPLLPVASPTQVVISKPLSFREIRGVFKSNMEFGLMPGTYKADRENSLGTYYVSDGYPVWQRNVDVKGSIINRGGFWVPKDESKPPQIYIIAESAQNNTNDLSSEISKRTVSVNSPIESNIARQNVPNASIAQTAVGSAVGGVIVQALINADVGSIYFIGESKDLDFNSNLQGEIKRGVNNAPSKSK